MSLADEIHGVVHQPRWAPRWGWHDDHRANDRTPAYLPAMQQNKSEFESLVAAILSHHLAGGRCLQLGMGACGASHEVWRCLFGHVATIDWNGMAFDDEQLLPGMDTHSPTAGAFAYTHGAYDFLFIDAGHKLDDVRRDYEFYSVTVRPGGIIAIHDALKRPGYEDECEAWRFLLASKEEWNLIGTEVGVAWRVMG